MVTADSTVQYRLCHIKRHEIILHKSLLRVKYAEFLRQNFAKKKMGECKRFPGTRLTKEFLNKNWKRLKWQYFLRKVQTSGSIECTGESGRPQ